MADVIVLEDIVKQFTMGDTILQALDHVNFSVEEGDFVAIMGPSGSGKSTMMNILGCLDRPTSGKYYLDGKEVAGLSDDELARPGMPKSGLCSRILICFPRFRLSRMWRCLLCMQACRKKNAWSGPGLPCGM